MMRAGADARRRGGLTLIELIIVVTIAGDPGDRLRCRWRGSR